VGEEGPPEESVGKQAELCVRRRSSLAWPLAGAQQGERTSIIPTVGGGLARGAGRGGCCSMHRNGRGRRGGMIVCMCVWCAHAVGLLLFESLISDKYWGCEVSALRVSPNDSIPWG